MALFFVLALLAGSPLFVAGPSRGEPATACWNQISLLPSSTHWLSGKAITRFSLGRTLPPSWHRASRGQLARVLRWAKEAQAGEPVTFHSSKPTLQAVPGGLRLVSSDGSVSTTAVSVAAGPGKGFSFRPRHKDQWLVLGLGASEAPGSYREMDYAVHCWSGGALWVWEKGVKQLRAAKKYEAGSLIELRVVGEEIQVWLDGEDVGYRRQLPKSRALHAVADFHSVNAEAFEIEWL